MKRLLYLLIGCSAVLWTSCSEDTTIQEEVPNTAPKCKITAPAEGQILDANLPLTVKGWIEDAENNVAVTRLSIGGQTVAEQLGYPNFECTVEPAMLPRGLQAIDLYVEDAGGLHVQHRVNVIFEKEARLMTGPSGEDRIAVGYWTEECEVRVIAAGKWSVSLPTSGRIETYDSATDEWTKKSLLEGQGPTTVRLRVGANDQFSDRTVELQIASGDESGKFRIEQAASPDMLETIEDEMLRMAAGISVVMYDMDPDEDGKISAYEAEIEPNERSAYGFDAGGWDVASTKGIENFPHLRHLDVNTTDKLTSIDLRGNPELMSLHVHNCPNLKGLDLSKQSMLIEIGCDFTTLLDVWKQIEKLKGQMHTIGAFNRTADQPSTLDFTGFSNLQRLYINDNKLTEVKLGGCVNLWRFVAGGNSFAEIDLSEVDRYRDNDYFMDNNPNLKRIYVWKGFTLDYYNSFKYDEANGVEIIEK